MKAVFFGWLLMLLVGVLNTFLVTHLLRARYFFLALALAVVVPSFVGFALAQMGVQLLGGGR